MKRRRKHSRSDARKMRSLWSILLIAGGAGALVVGANPSCTRQLVDQRPKAKSEVPKRETVQAAQPDQSESIRTTYADAIRQRDFDRAAWLIDGAPEIEKKAPEVRYARGLVAVELGDPETALRSVDGLEKEWPDFAPEVRDLRREAAKLSGDVTLLSHFLDGTTEPEELLALAEAHAMSSSAQKAKQLAESALKRLTGSKRKNRLSLIAQARNLRARTLVLEDKKTEAAKEYHWLATSAASLDEAADLDSKIPGLDPKQALTPAERLKRAEQFSEKGWVKRTKKELLALAEDGQSTPSTEQTDAIVAWAVYIARSDYEEAAQLFQKAASHGGPNRTKHLYYEAKSLARSHRDQEAVAKYEVVASLGGSYADHGAFQAARLRFIDGQWKESVKAYEAYLKKYGGSARHRTDTLHDLPIARLASGDFKRAVNELQKLMDKEKSERRRTRLLQLQGVAYLGLKDTAKAEALFRQVIETRPLSFPAMMAKARLSKMGLPQPPLLPPARTLSQQELELPPLDIPLPTKVFRLTRVGLDDKAEAALIRTEAQIRAQYGSRGGEALCAVYGKLESARRRFQVAQWAASWKNLRTEPDARTSWEWDCIYPTPYRDVAEHHGALRKVPTGFIYGVMRQESAFRPTVVSPAKAVGLMQIIPPTAKRIAGEIDATYEPHLMRSPAVNIQFGAYYLRRLLDMFGDRHELAAAAYNAGPHAVTRWLRAGETLPLDIFVARIPYKETRNYVYRVMGNYARYAYREDPTLVPTVELELPKGLKAPRSAY